MTDSSTTNKTSADARTKAKVTRAVIPVAGLGTRMLPATKSIPKEMLPIVDRPLIQYVVDEAVKSGIRDIVFVTHSSKNAIENHFDRSFELESELGRRAKRQQLNDIKSICSGDVTIMHVRQGETKGLAHAISRARHLIGNEPFAVILPDVLINQYRCNLETDNLSEMIKRFEETGRTQILVERIDKALASSYGIVDVSDEVKARLNPVAGAGAGAGTGTDVDAVADADIDAGDTGLPEGFGFAIRGFVEKPKNEPPSNLAIAGRYVLPGDIWGYLEDTPMGAGDEIQLTDTLRLMLRDREIDGYVLKGQSLDCGNKLGYIKAFIEYSLASEKFGRDVSEYIRAICGRTA
ncbi:MAG: UTP--glucose-1-phosphate uridylyltransferase [Succinivibrionaceae bacterium]|nr:UTP--glucose-1-phosphate uridylyltransferase [Succinivibrionaceae bacterium]